MTEQTSFLKRHRSCLIICVVLLIALVVTSTFLAVALYTNLRSYYFEQNMHTYAMGVTCTDLRDWMSGLAYDAEYNQSDLNQAVRESEWVLENAAERLAYMDQSHENAWNSLSAAFGDIAEMADRNQFFGNSTGWTAQICQYVVLLNDAILNVPLNLAFTLGTYLYDQNGNVFLMNETAITSIQTVSAQLSSLYYQYGG